MPPQGCANGPATIPGWGVKAASLVLGRCDSTDDGIWNLGQLGVARDCLSRVR
jgi:hypothetical protein